MIFSFQRFVEDYVSQRGLSDGDNYAVKVANVFWKAAPSIGLSDLQEALSRVRSNFFRINRTIAREEFEANLAKALRARFSRIKDEFAFFERGFAPARARLRVKRRSIKTLLAEFKQAVEARAIDSFWTSRKAGTLRAKPESIAQGLLAVFAQHVVGKRGAVLREFSSGIGFVDVGITFTGLLHLVELKVLDGPMKGPSQLAAYMHTERRNVGWLLLLDVRKNNTKPALPSVILTPQGTIHVVVIELNPTPPHLL